MYHGVPQVLRQSLLIRAAVELLFTQNLHLVIYSVGWSADVGNRTHKNSQKFSMLAGRWRLLAHFPSANSILVRFPCTFTPTVRLPKPKAQSTNDIQCSRHRSFNEASHVMVEIEWERASALISTRGPFYLRPEYFCSRMNHKYSPFLKRQ